ncbi:MAG: SiaB family protein kinase [Crocinitomicaceae bacterium]
MSLRSIYNLYKSLEEESILLSFKGVFTSDLLTSILQIMESKLSYLEESPKIKKKVFNVLVECLQNLHHHMEEGTMVKDGEEMRDGRTALLMITRIEGCFFVRTGNYILKSASIDLEEKISKINTLEREDLKLYYQQVLSEGQRSDKGTAGLGMIDIARKSGNKLDCMFIDVNEEYRFFCLNVKID